MKPPAGLIPCAILTRGPAPTSRGEWEIDWGVYGVPETFVIDRHGRIAYKHVGAITPDVMNKKLKPLLAKLKADKAH